MTPRAYIQSFPRNKRSEERKRLAAAVGVTVATVRAWTEINDKLEPLRYCGDPAMCLNLQKLTRGMVSVAEWNPRFAVLVKA